MFDVMEDLRLGEHAALFYRSKADQLCCAIPYIVIGLQRNERCVYIAVDNSVTEIARHLESAGVDVEDARQRDALRIVTREQTYLRHGLFEPDKMIEDFHTEVESALKDGFTGLRASGEMSWALDLPSALARVIEYEEKLHAHWPSHLGGLCQFDESRFPPRLINEMIRMHRIIVRGGRIIRKASSLDTPISEDGELVYAG